MTVGDVIQELFEFDLNTEVYEYDGTGGLTPFDGDALIVSLLILC